MHVYHGLSQLPQAFGPSVVTLGNFDGVHRGHQQVLSWLVAEAVRQKASSVVITFDPHPLEVHRPDSAPGQIMSLAQRLDALASTGLDATVVIRYTLDFARSTPEEFVRSVLVGNLQAKTVVVGQDVRFGRDNSGDLHTMQEMGEQFGFAVVVVDELGERRRWSSTWVREALDRGAVEEAADILGHPHTMVGEVVHGAARGRDLGFPTANLAPEAEGYIPADGVYAGWLVDAAGTRWPAAISVGSNPTFEGVSRQVEAHVLDRPVELVEDFDLYGQRVRVEFVARLRGMVAYTGPEALIEQMCQDVADSRIILAEAAKGVER
ncbi:bifunctional riboflavin kinase/FAD synthetase [Psychromicrobium xiongbiense]|uniref:bifunctional riboflavin kinase/FAD synthetase n=1 Tax=Psychromicrobium xiongbiense TaxID=3051184 RepID=UPI0025572628|nr:bifunctional riboflavin kinase/FAD synthetase [Psychromicrobium sp. YIM S02556]